MCTEKERHCPWECKDRPRNCRVRASEFNQRKSDRSQRPSNKGPRPCRVQTLSSLTESNYTVPRRTLCLTPMHSMLIAADNGDN